jgi:hypothetical protein
MIRSNEKSKKESDSGILFRELNNLKVYNNDFSFNQSNKSYELEDINQN